MMLSERRYEQDFPRVTPDAHQAMTGNRVGHIGWKMSIIQAVEKTLTIHCPIIATGTPQASLLIVTLKQHLISR